MIAQALTMLLKGDNLDPETANEAAHALMTGDVPPAQCAALLTALRMKGETVPEVVAFAKAMQRHVVPVVTGRKPLLDTCGTGGSTFKTFNVSTCVAILLASRNIAVAKHGNRAMSGTCGSADVLEALGVSLALTPERAGKLLDTLGIAFLFAQTHHPAMRHVAAVRRELGFRTVFNLLGPLSNPAGATLQLMGVYEERLCTLAANALRELGSTRALIVHNRLGADEILTLGETYCAELRDGEVRERLLTPADFGLQTRSEPDIVLLAPADTREANAALVRRVLAGTEMDAQDTARLNLVAVNAGAALTLTGDADTLRDGFERARVALKSGAGLETLDALIRATNQKSTI